MTETPENRSKRDFIAHLNNECWVHQVSIFFNNYSDCSDALDHFATIRKRISRVLNDQPFLWRIGLLNAEAKHYDDLGPEGPKVLVPYMTMFTDTATHYTKVLKVLGKMSSSPDVRVINQQTGETRRNGYIKKVKSEDPHDLNTYFNEAKVNRFGVLNEKHVPK